MNKFIKIILIFFAIVIIVLVIREVIKTYKKFLNERHDLPKKR